MSNTATTAKDAKTAEWNTLTDLLGDLLVEINDLLGLRSRYSLDDTREQGLTFGYLGNVEFGEDDRSWYVFLPHPGRIGTSEDRMGGFSTGNTEAVVHLHRRLETLKDGIELAARYAKF